MSPPDPTPPPAPEAAPPTSEPPRAEPAGASCRVAWVTAVGVAVAYGLICLGVILAGGDRQRAAYDQNAFHLPAIETFAEQWPRPDVSDYLSATTPGYHLVLTVVGMVVGIAETPLRVAGLGFSLGLVLTLVWWTVRRAGVVVGVVASLPLLASPYFFDAACWLLPDNAGWWGVLGMLLLAWRRPQCVWTLVLGGVVLTLLVLMRQIHLWAAAPLWVAAWLGPTRFGSMGFGRVSFAEEPHPERLLLPLTPRIPPAMVALGCSLPAFAVVGAFVALWGGLTPPTFQEGYHGGNLAAPAFLLALLGIFSLFFAGYLVEPAREVWRRGRWWAVGAVGAGLAVSIVAPTGFDREAGRWTGLWNVVDRTPLIGGHTTPLMVVLAVVGALALLLWCRVLAFRERWILLGALVAFAAAQAVSRELWQRYNEPFVLMVLALLASVAASRRPEPSSVERLAWVAGPVVLACGLVAVLLVTW